MADTPKGTSRDLLSSQVSSAVKQVVALGERIRSELKTFDESLAAVGKNYGQLLGHVIARLSELPGEVEKIQFGLSELGWFALPELPMDEYFKLEESLAVGDAAKLNRVLSEWTIGLLNEIENDLCEHFPDRADLLVEAFDNHRNARYASAITLLLTQADGICWDTLGKIFFSVDRTTHLPRINEVVDGLGVELLSRITLTPVLIKAGINASDSDIAAGVFPLSPHRHLILHGRDVTYATELNSLKVISFVAFMGGIVHPIIEEVKNSPVSGGQA